MRLSLCLSVVLLFAGFAGSWAFAAPDDRAKPPPRRDAKAPLRKKAASPSREPAVRPVKVGPQSRTKVTAKPRVIKWRYLMFFRGNKVGEMNRVEKWHPGGKVEVTVTSQSKMKIFFRTYKSSLKSRSVYVNHKLQSFEMDSLQRGKRIIVKAQRQGKGMMVKRTQGKTTKSKLFPFHTFTATSNDLRLPMHPPGNRVKRRLLQLQQMKVVTQHLNFQKYVTKTFQGKHRKLVKILAKGPRGKAHMIFNPRGWMYQISFRISLLGSYTMKLRERKGS